MFCDSQPDSLLCPTDVAALADLGTITPRTPPSTPEERAFDQLPEQSLLDSKSLSSLLADLLGRGKLPVCIHANGSVFQISEVQEAADRPGCENPGTLTCRFQRYCNTTTRPPTKAKRDGERRHLRPCGNSRTARRFQHTSRFLGLLHSKPAEAAA
ncbi:uncharacterized protein L3040_009178 [Drepanopeziza brunnea f. sp. 'multigermtubi']|uniref:uncharacterized protein n=1 Tax=Drepanopeziza brunnea f. sp. 'multigermtubi' TaxID=698441 RepID=UPI0023922CF9|nr:hypothetical protein L3040_009178 [Drepanopeziza brunnea f. sp. 'multigermtubi']